MVRRGRPRKESTSVAVTSSRSRKRSAPVVPSDSSSAEDSDVTENEFHTLTTAHRRTASASVRITTEESEEEENTTPPVEHVTVTPDLSHLTNSRLTNLLDNGDEEDPDDLFAEMDENPDVQDVQALQDELSPQVRNI